MNAMPHPNAVEIRKTELLTLHDAIIAVLGGGPMTHGHLFARVCMATDTHQKLTEFCTALEQLQRSERIEVMQMYGVRLFRLLIGAGDMETKQEGA